MIGKHDIDRDLAIRELKQQLANKIAWNDNWRTAAKHTAALNKSLVKQLAEKDAEIERLTAFVDGMRYIFTRPNQNTISLKYGYKTYLEELEES